MKASRHSLISFGEGIPRVADAPFLFLSSSELAHRALGADVDSDCFRSSLSPRIFLPGGEDDHAGSREIWKSLPLCFDESGRVRELIEEAGLAGSSLADREAPDRAEEKLVLETYDCWIDNLLKRRGLATLSVSIYFEYLERAQVWEKALAADKPRWLKEVMFPREKPVGEEMVAKHIRDVNVWRHIKLRRDVLDEQIEPRLYYEFATFHNAFFSFLSSISPSESHFVAAWVLRQIVEAALLRVLVVDDRIARTLWSRPDGKTRLEELAYQNVWVAGAITVGKKRIPLVEEACNNEGGLIEVQWERDGSFNGAPDDCAILRNDEGVFDILLMHQTVFDDKLSEYLDCSGEDWKERWVFETKKKIPYVIFHSGRGKQEAKLPKNAPFLEYSALQEYILREPSKFFLSALVLAAKGQWDGK